MNSQYHLRLWAADGGSSNVSHAILPSSVATAAFAVSTLGQLLRLTFCSPLLFSVYTKNPSSSYPMWARRVFSSVFTIIIRNRRPRRVLSRPEETPFAHYQYRRITPPSLYPEPSARLIFRSPSLGSKRKPYLPSEALAERRRSS